MSVCHYHICVTFWKWFSVRGTKILRCKTELEADCSLQRKDVRALALSYTPLLPIWKRDTHTLLLFKKNCLAPSPDFQLAYAKLLSQGLFREQTENRSLLLCNTVFSGVAKLWSFSCAICIYDDKTRLSLLISLHVSSEHQKKGFQLWMGHQLRVVKDGYSGFQNESPTTPPLLLSLKIVIFLVFFQLKNVEAVRNDHYLGKMHTNYVRLGSHCVSLLCFDLATDTWHLVRIFCVIFKISLPHMQNKKSFRLLRMTSWHFRLQVLDFWYEAEHLHVD